MPDLQNSKMRRMSELGTDFWNDSCDLNQLKDALENNAVGATSNPVIVSATVRSNPELWNPVIDRLIAENPTADEDCIAWKLTCEVAGKAAEAIERGYRSILLSAAYRNHMHWSAFIGDELTVSIPYKWWKRFNASKIEVKNRIDDPVRVETINELQENFIDFRRAYESDGMAPGEFLSFGATVHTLKQFIHMVSYCIW